MEIEEAKRIIKNNTVEKAYQLLLLGNEVWYFKYYLLKSDYSTIYESFKRFISDKFNIHFSNIQIMGSAKIGFSMSPENEFRPFKISLQEENPSDIDLVIVSREYFEKFWMAYLKKSKEKHVPKYTYISSCIFRKFISFDGFDSYDKEFRDWKVQVGDFQKDIEALFDIKHNVNYRIFESWGAVDLYYQKSLQELKKYIGENTDEFRLSAN